MPSEGWLGRVMSCSNIAAAPAHEIPQKAEAVVDMVPIVVELEPMAAPVPQQLGFGSIKPRRLAVWLGQTIASTSWIISVLSYEAVAGEEWSEGDRLQMMAACAWTVSNLLALPDVVLSE